MNENGQKNITVDDFNFICRVCLEIGEDMIDIFRSGLENQIMEVTNLKMELDDKMPKTLCQKCNHQINQLFIFLQQAKSSDVYLKTLLADSERSSTNTIFKGNEETNFNKTSSHGKKWSKKSKLIKKIKSDLESEKMYLIFVPEMDSCHSKADKKIVIKELDSDCENLELKNYCKNLLKSYFSDHMYPKDVGDSSHHCPSESINSNCFSELRFTDSRIRTVNLHIYECNDCKSAFEDLDELTAHFKSHNVQPHLLNFNFDCPVCDFSISTKLSFMDHLKIHKEEGFLFVKINGAGGIMPVKENERNLFTESFTKDCKIYKVNLNSLNCTACSENIKSTGSILNHLESCLSSKKSEIKYCINYLCPICCKLYVNEEKKFIEHLSFHRRENYFFIKVDNSGEPVQLNNNDELFIPYEEAVKLFIKKSTIFQIVDINSCDKCEFTSNSLKDLQEHCNYVHFENIADEKISLCCPVCTDDCQGKFVVKKQIEFYDHLRLHKSEGFSFILVNKNGIMAENDGKYSEIFTQSLFLWSLINSSVIMIHKISPELIILDQNESLENYTCDLCKKEFRKKHEIITHLKSHQIQKMIQDNVKYICEKCGKKCSGKINYKKHFLKHLKSLSTVSKRPFCSICNKTFANKTTLHRHMKYHMKEGLQNELFTSSFGIICEKCGKSFSNNASLAKHKKIHAKEKENNGIKCDICDRDFFRQSSFDRHKSAHLNPKYFECGICKLPLPSLTSMQKHSEVHKNGSITFDCRTCKLSFLTKDSLTAHQTHTGHYLDKKPLECNVCHEKFYIGRKFTEHIKTHPKYKMGECTLCGKRLSTIQSLMLHMGRHFESNSILCPHCGKQFFEERNYHRHLLTHEGIKPFSCDIEGCKKSFYTLFELNRHKKYHNNTRDFRCLYCSKSFHEANHLTVHVRTHTGERPYTCPHCNKGFVTRTHCKHHIKLVHQGIGYDLIKSNISKKVTVFETLETIA